MKLRLSELRIMVRRIVAEMAMPDRTREIERLWREYSSAVRAGGFEPTKLKKPGWWKIPGKQLEIPEFVNVDMVYYPDIDLPDLRDEPYGMYRNTDLEDDLRMPDEFKGTPTGVPRKEVPEQSRHYTLAFQYDADEKLWSVQKFLRHLPTLITRSTFYHELGHLTTARVVPPQPHVKNFFGTFDGNPEEMIGMTSEVFADLYARYKDSPRLFKRDFPTFRDFLNKNHDAVESLESTSYSNNPVSTEEDLTHDDRWVMKTLARFYRDLSGE